MRRKLWITFGCIVLLTILAGYISWPNTTTLKIGSWTRDVSLRQGLDLKGGADLLYEADTSQLHGQDVNTAMEGVREVFEGRVNTLGVTEPDIRLTTNDGKPSIDIQLPGVSDVTTAKNILGKTAKLEFKDESGNVVLQGSDIIADDTTAEPASTTSTGLSNSASWEVKLQLTTDGTKKFATATEANLNKQIGIYLDDQLISAPTVNQAITSGTAIISGSFTPDQARQFALQLQSGALPVPVNLVSEQTVGASLGADAISESLLAGLIGVILVGFFLIAYYRWCGVIATLALIVYGLLNIFVFKMLPVTMTLAGIAGFIISIGISVDTNVLTFERLKEELRLNKPLPIAIQESFRRSWTSIRDSHLAGLISASIIFIFASGPVRGFAVVLIIGTLLSLFSAITVTRNWMMLIAGSRLQKILHLK